MILCTRVRGIRRWSLAAPAAARAGPRGRVIAAARMGWSSCHVWFGMEKISQFFFVFLNEKKARITQYGFIAVLQSAGTKQGHSNGYISKK